MHAKHKIQDQTLIITNFDGHPNLTCYYFAMSNFALVTYPTSHQCFFQLFARARLVSSLMALGLSL